MYAGSHLQMSTGLSTQYKRVSVSGVYIQGRRCLNCVCLFSSTRSMASLYVQESRLVDVRFSRLHFLFALLCCPLGRERALPVCSVSSLCRKISPCARDFLFFRQALDRRFIRRDVYRHHTCHITACAGACRWIDSYLASWLAT